MNQQQTKNTTELFNQQKITRDALDELRTVPNVCLMLLLWFSSHTHSNKIYIKYNKNYI